MYMQKKKDLIIITAHCPSEDRRAILLDLVIGLQPVRKDFDLMVISHTPISTDVQERVNWSIYDEDNELLKDWIYQNEPWFSPNDTMRIQSIFFGSGNTYLTLHKQLITGYAMSKAFGYEKVQFIEYDAYFQDFTEFYNNSRALDEYDAILYTKNDSVFDTLEYGIGNFHAAKISSMPESIFKFDREEILNEIENSASKTTEVRTHRIYTSENRKVLFKDHNLIMKNGNILRMVDFHKGEFEMQWAIPFYDHSSDEIRFLVWNEASEKPTDVVVIVNNEKIVNFNKIEKFQWSIKTLGHPNDIKNITILINNKMKRHIELNENNIDLFKELNRIYYQNE
jgi:hypothetical protein